VKPIVPIAAAAAPGKRPDTNRGYSAEVWAAFRLAIIDSSNVDLATDAVRAAIDGARGNGGRCVACNTVNFETKAPAAFAVKARSRGGEDPIVHGIFRGCSVKHNHSGLRYRARERFAL
jgi:hypothetical protein